MRDILKVFFLCFFYPVFLVSCGDPNESMILNTAPSIEEQSFSIEENSINGTFVGEVIASDLDQNQTLSYTILGGDPNNVFKIDENTGIITVNHSELLNFESAPLYELGIEVSDNGEEPASNAAKITIRIEDMAESQYINLTENICNGKDAIISQIVPNNNYGNLEDIDLYAWTQGGDLNVNRFLIDFTFQKIPKGATIDSAFISLYFNNTSVFASSHSGENQFYVERIVSSWNESMVTWNNQPTTTFVNRLSYDQATIGTKDLAKLTITALVQDIVNNLDNSYGLMFKLQSETPYKMLLFSSSDHSNTDLHPKLEVYYTSK